MRRSSPDTFLSTMSAPHATTPGINNVDNTVEGFLASAHPWWVPPVEDLAFSGLYNSAVGAVVDGTTPVREQHCHECELRHLRHVHDA